MIKSNINSIYKATEGEGIFIGRPQYFVRFQGCSIGCLNCDSKGTWSFDKKNLIANENILKTILEISNSIKWVSITGGDPLHKSHQESVMDLIHILKKEDFKINIEASGLLIAKEIFDAVNFISWDIKLPSTGVNYNYLLISKMLKLYSTKLQIKSVIQDKNDFLELLDIRKNYLNEDFDNWIITPAFCTDEQNIMQRFKMINLLNENEGNLFRVIGQQHKWIYGAKATNV